MRVGTQPEPPTRWKRITTAYRFRPAPKPVMLTSSASRWQSNRFMERNHERCVVLQAAMSQAGAPDRANEDAWGHCENAAWVVDGATGVEEHRVCPGPTDAAWFAGEMSRQLAAVVKDCESVVSAIELALQRVREALNCCGSKLPAGRLGPTASIALALARRGEIEIGILGDCRAIEVRFDGTIIVHGDSNLRKLDSDLTKAVHDIRQQDCSPIEQISKIAALEYRLRSRANREGGYWILDLTGSAVRFTQLIRLAIPELRALILVTDGIYRLVDIYSEHTDNSFAEELLQSGPERLFDRLRAIEMADPLCRRFQRVKPQDDATLVVIGTSARDSFDPGQDRGRHGPA
jgi:hypothetical protein